MSILPRTFEILVILRHRYVFLAIFIFLSALHIFDVVQTWLLFHNAVSQGVVVDNILKQARRSQEADNPPDTSTEIRDLRRMVEDQQRTIAELLSTNPRFTATGHDAATSTVSSGVGSGVVAPDVVSDTNLRGVRASPHASVSFDLPQAAASQYGPGFTFQSPDQMPPRA